MRKLIWTTILALGLGGAQAAPFINLDFEMADTNNVQFQLKEYPDTLCVPGKLFGSGRAHELLPGWTVYSGIESNVVDLAAFGYGFVETNLTYDPHAGLYYENQIIVDHQRCLMLPTRRQGDYGLVLDNSVFASGPPTTNFPVAIFQRGDIPINADTLTFLFSGSFGVDAAVRIEDTEFVFQQSLADKYEFDVSPWAGTTVTLSLLSWGAAAFDDLQFIQTRPHPPTLTGSAGTNQFALSWPSQPGFEFQVEVTTNLPAVWQPLGGVVITTGGTSQCVERFSATNQPTAQRFYRLRALP